MDASSLVILLPIATFVLVMAFAWRSKKKTEEKRKSNDDVKSTLAADAPNKR